MVGGPPRAAHGVSGAGVCAGGHSEGIAVAEDDTAGEPPSVLQGMGGLDRVGRHSVGLLCPASGNGVRVVWALR